MAINPMCGSKWEPVYEEPFQIEQHHQRGAYSLVDSMGEIMDRRFTIDMLKLITELTALTAENREQIYEIEAMLNHRQSNSGYDYLVKWKFYPMEDNSWVLPQISTHSSRLIYIGAE
jgi:hypothetical protein